MTVDHDPSGHLTPEDLAAYADVNVAQSERGRIEQHLASCATCRAELTAVVRRAPSRRGRAWLWIPIGAAAAVALLFFKPDAVDDGLRFRTIQSVATMTAIAPADGGTVSLDSLAFAWQPAGSDASYRVTVTNEDGDVVWTETTADTVITVGTGVPVREGTTYFWYVDALLVDGSSTTTGVMEFSTSQ